MGCQLMISIKYIPPVNKKVKIVGDSQPRDVLSNKTFMNANGEQRGTMPIITSSAQKVTTQGEVIRIPEGYHNGTGTVTADILNLKPENIRNGYYIGNVLGNYSGDTAQETRQNGFFSKDFNADQYRQKDYTYNEYVQIDRVPKLKKIVGVQYVLSNIQFFVPGIAFDPNEAERSSIYYSFDYLNFGWGVSRGEVGTVIGSRWFKLEVIPRQPKWILDNPDGTSRYEVGWTFKMSTDRREYFQWGGMAGSTGNQYQYDVLLIGVR